MAEHFRLVFNIIYSYIICIQKHIYMYNLNFYIFSISHPLWTDDIFFFGLRNVMFCESPKKVGFNVARMNTWSRAAGPGRGMTPEPPPSALQVTTPIGVSCRSWGYPQARWMVYIGSWKILFNISHDGSGWCCYIWCAMDPINKNPSHVSIYTSTMDPSWV